MCCVTPGTCCSAPTSTSRAWYSTASICNCKIDTTARTSLSEPASRDSPNQSPVMKYVLLFILIVSSVAVLLAQQAPEDASRLQAPAAQIGPVGATLALSASDQPPLTNETESAVAGGALLLDVGDVLDVRVFDTPELSGKLRVDSQGRITLPVGGTVEVKGLTPEQVQVVSRAAVSPARDSARPTCGDFRTRVCNAAGHGDGRGQNAGGLSHWRKAQRGGFRFDRGRANGLRLEDCRPYAQERIGAAHYRGLERLVAERAATAG